MKQVIFLVCLCCIIQQNISLANNPTLLYSDTIIQDFHRIDKVKATKKEALIRMKVTDMRKHKLSDLPLWVHNKQGQHWYGKTDENGEVFFLLPNNTKYQVNVDQEENYRKFTIPKEAQLTKTVKVVLMTSRIKETERNDTIFQNLAQGMAPTRSRVLVKNKIFDLDEEPLANEVLYFEAQNTKKVYHSLTNSKGESSLMLPKGDTYCVHSYAFRDITCKTFETSNTSRTSRFELATISTTAFKQRALERKRLLAERDSIRRIQRLRDSAQLARAEYQHFYLQHFYKKTDFKVIENKIKQAVLNDQKAITANPNHFTELGEEIKSILQRNKDTWPQKRIIANIDCSMYDYIDELMVWNFSDQNEQQNNSYWLFNGFNYIGEEHGEQSRRGIFHVPENSVEGWFNTIDKIVNFSCRGSRLENVVEALILGADGKTEKEDLLFIADNYSDVSDLDKLKELKVPVHVLLTASRYGINENYLEIAYRTGGSIHTNSEDINSDQLTKLKDGQLLRVGQFTYTFFKGKFLKSTS